jgi:hypothetical protein
MNWILLCYNFYRNLLQIAFVTSLYLQCYSKCQPTDSLHVAYCGCWVHLFIYLFIYLMFCSKQCREVGLHEPQLYIIPHSIPQGRIHIWHWGQCHIHNLLCICLWLPPTIVDTDFIFTVSKTESAAILHHLFHVSSKTVCFHIVFWIVLYYWGFHSFAVRIQISWVVDSWYFKGMYL